MQLTDFARQLPEEVWQLFQPRLPPVVWCGNGRPPASNSDCLHAVFSVLVSGIAWRMLPTGFPSYKTVQRRLQIWLQRDAFRTAWQQLAHRYEALQGINGDPLLDGSKKPSKKGANRRGRARSIAASVARPCIASVAHELSNPLAIILMQADLLREEAGSGPLAETPAALSQAATRCQRLVRTFLTLARQQAPERTAVDLNALITGTLELLAQLLRVDTIAVELRLAGDLPRLWADPHQLQQVLVNLLTNAQQALRDVAPPRQVTLTTRYDPVRLQVTLEVADTGPGMPPAIRARIFEPFFTTKPPGVGTGLGLPLCQGIIEDHGGTIGVTSAPGQGTTFRVELPVGVVSALPPAPAGTEETRPTVPSLAILLVDDEPGITKVLPRLLQRDGPWSIRRPTVGWP